MDYYNIPYPQGIKMELEDSDIPGDLTAQERGYIKEARRQLKEFIDANNAEGWEDQGKLVKGMKVETRQGQRPENVMMRGSLDFPFDKEIILEYMFKVDERKHYDK